MERNPETQTCVVCVNTDCKARGSLGILQTLRENLNAAGSEVTLQEHLCVGGCDRGPNIVLLPNGTWYQEVQPEDVPEITKHILGGPPVERLTAKVDPSLRDTIIQVLEMFY